MFLNFKKGYTGRYQQSIAFYGIFIALAMIFSYIEILIPIHLGIPGVKLGLANLIAMVSIYILGFRPALIISMVRIVLVSISFGNVNMMMYSIVGALLSLICMYFIKSTKLFSMVGVSVFGGITHNIGQILVAYFVLRTVGVFGYLPILIISGIVTGTLIGLLTGLVLKRIEGITL